MDVPTTGCTTPLLPDLAERTTPFERTETDFEDNDQKFLAAKPDLPFVRERSD